MEEKDPSELLFYLLDMINIINTSCIQLIRVGIMLDGKPRQ